MKKYILKSDCPAKDWEHASPIGNGCMGAMVYGNVATERIQLNHEKLWSEVTDRTLTSPDFREKIDTFREMFLNGNPLEAENWINENLAHAQHRVASYETAGELFLDFNCEEEQKDYKREINLNDGILTVSYKKGDVNYNRTYFASYPAKVITAKLSADKPKSISFDAYFKRENTVTYTANADSLQVRVKTAKGEHYLDIKIDFIPIGGKSETVGDKIRIINANECQIIISMSAERAEIKSYETLLKEHIDDFSSLMARSDIILPENAQLEELPVSQRLAAIRNGAEDNGLFSLYFQFGKYLLISSSRPGTLPANLQGVWNQDIEAIWGSDYHTNINLQMNYWPSEVANLPECHLPLFDYMENCILKSGKETAKINYKCRGMVLHHVSDIYGHTVPSNGPWSLWPMGGAWLCYHYYEHYLYTLDEKFLRERAYNVFKENVLFFLDFMFEDENGRLLTGPSSSPENKFYSDGKAIFLCLSPTMDVEIISGLFRIFLDTQKTLNICDELTQEVETALKKMPPLKVGKRGQLMEWLEDYDEVEPGHRHISHAFALYPDCAINPNTPELFEAIKKSIEIRLENGGGHTGWSRAWIILMYARLLMPEKALENFLELLKKSTNDNFLDIHPPFQIDGNFGGAAGLTEMLLQSQNGVILLLPALPKNWHKGEAKGLACRGGVTVDFAWENSKLTSATFYSETPRQIKIKLQDKTEEITVNGKYVLNV